MRWNLLDGSVKEKLVTVPIVGNVLVICVVVASFITYASFDVQRQQHREIDTLAELVSLTLAKSIAASGPVGAKNALASLSRQSGICLAEVNSPEGETLARYRGPDTVVLGLSLPKWLKGPRLERHLFHDGARVGTLVVQFSKTGLLSPLLFAFVVLLATGVGSWLLALLLSRRFDRIIMDPIFHLTQKMEIVTRRHDLQVRVEKRSDDELGLLYDCFNEMLAEMEVRDERLALHREELKVEVAQRTQELSVLNRQLEKTLPEVKNAMRTAQAASRAKSRFLAQMSHEIRTPVYGILGMTELLFQTELNKEQTRYLETARHSGEALLSIINGILDFSKIEAGKMELEVINFDIYRTVQVAVEPFVDDAQRKGLELSYHVASEVPRYLKGDPVRLRQVMVNLLANALKFTLKGEVRLEVALADKPSLLRISVSDTGIGIPPEAQRHIFNQFAQADQSVTRRYGGTGLGLAIARQMTELMGGEISVASQPGNGSTFSFTVRLEIPGEQEQGAAERGLMALRGKRVLVVADGCSCSHILHRQASFWGMEVESAADGREALQMVRLSPFDVALIDTTIADADGIELARALRSEPAGHLLGVVFLAQEEVELERAKNAGFECLKKPVRQSMLYQALVRALGTERCARESSLLSHCGQPPVVLLVEDNEVNQEVSRGMLESIGCRVEVADNGLKAIAAILQTRYDLVFMDCQMPEMDGMEATRWVRQWEQGGLADIPDQAFTDSVGIPSGLCLPYARPSISGLHLPIVAITAHAMNGDRDACLAAGADDYLSKPFTREDLARVIRRQVGNAAARLPADQSSTSSWAQQGLDEVPHALAIIQSLSGTKGMEVLRKVVHLYLATTPTLLQTLREAESGSDANMLKAAAHSFKSSSANLGALRLAGACRKLEALGQSGSTEGAGPLLQTLETEYLTVRNALMGGVL